MIEKFTVSRDDSIYQAWPDVALTPSGKLVCVFAECTHHGDRGYTRIDYVTSEDRGRTWSPKRALTEPLRGDPAENPWWNCPRISTLADGRLVAVVDRIVGREPGVPEVYMWFSTDEAETWTGPVKAPVVGIVPDQLVELSVGDHAGRWVLSAHTKTGEGDATRWVERCWLTDDQGQTWSGPHTVASADGLKLCEGSIVELPGGELVCFLRENSGMGLDAYKAVSRDGGVTWDGLCRFPLPGCHRPVAGMLASGNVMITYRFMQGGKGWLGSWTQNFFAAITSVESCLAAERNQAGTRILPVDFDRSGVSDLGYSGWVQFSDGELYVVNYIVDDAAPKAQIRGYAFGEGEFLLPTSG